MKLVAGNSNRPLAEAIAKYLNIPLTKSDIRRFADEEVFVELQENVRGEDVFIIQSTSFPANDNLMELLITIDALRRASARRITAVIPYFGYARQDRKPGPRTPISAKLVANLIEAAGADRVLTLDLHAGQIQGFFDIPTDNLFGAPVFVEDIQSRFNGDDLMVVSPDVGGVVRTRAFISLSFAPLGHRNKEFIIPLKVRTSCSVIFVRISIFLILRTIAGFFSGGARNPASSRAFSRCVNILDNSPRFAGRVSVINNTSAAVSSL